MKKRLKSFSVSLTALFFVLVSMPFCAFALSDECFDSKSFWNECENIIQYDDPNGLNGFVKYNVSEDDGCFYFQINFCDMAIEPNMKDRIYFRFNVRNETDSVTFDVDENGFSSKTSNDTKSKIALKSDFYSTSCRNRGGKVVVAFELKSKDFRRQKNYISCEYFCGSDINYIVFENIILDMTVPTTEKKTTVKTAKKKTTKQSTAKKSKTTKATKFTPSKYKTTHSVKQTTTKFNTQKPTETTKFVASSTINNDLQDDEKYWSSIVDSVSETTTSESTVKSKFTIKAIIVIIIAALVLIAGIVTIIYGAVGIDRDYELAQEEYDDNSDE